MARVLTVRPSVEIIRQPDGAFKLRGPPSRSLWMGGESNVRQQRDHSVGGLG